MESRRRADRYAVAMSPEVLQFFRAEAGPWHETEAEIEAGLAWGAEKERLLAWVRTQMAAHLTDRERICLEMHYFDDLTFREIGARTGTNASSACRAVARSLRKLKAALKDNSPAAELNRDDRFRKNWHL